MKILIIIVLIWMIICVICLIKYLQFNKTLKQVDKELRKIKNTFPDLANRIQDLQDFEQSMIEKQYNVPDRLLLNQDKVSMSEISSSHESNPVKVPFAQGLFIRKDDFGKDCFIGDTVEVIRPAMEIPTETNLDGFIEIPEQTFTGTLVLLKTKGVLIKNSKSIGSTYIKAPLTNHSRNKWTWRKI
jgi:hypothetical protein